MLICVESVTNFSKLVEHTIVPKRNLCVPILFVTIVQLQSPT